jgi:hypothetical protein
MQSSYFDQIDRQQRTLERHGFDSYPCEEEVLEYAMSLEDRIEALCDYLDAHLEQDVRGRWHAREGKTLTW